MEIVGKFFPADKIATDFLALAKEEIGKGPHGWKGEFIVRHNTGSPTLAQRPHGLTAQHIQNLKSFYEGKGWHAGPHGFVDDNGFWVFSPLSAPGVHSPSWNNVSYGIEMLGDFGPEDFNSGRGMKVHQNTAAVFAVITHVAGIDSDTMRDHREDPQTTHKDCPGDSAHNHKIAFQDEVHQYIQAHLA